MKISSYDIKSAQNKDCSIVGGRKLVADNKRLFIEFIIGTNENNASISRVNSRQFTAERLMEIIKNYLKRK